MSDFDKKKSTTNDKKNSNINIDNIDEDAYEIPDIVSSGKKSNKMEDKKEKKKKPEHTQKHVFENRLHHHKKEKEKSGHSGGSGVYFRGERKGQVPDGRGKADFP